ncbi:MAG: hypothetical protein ACFE9J_15465 [Candidatus Hermodarchaeota archaeon]
MRKTQEHEQDFRLIFQNSLKIKDQEQIFEYIINHSNLPGRRANLEMAFAFGNVIIELPKRFDDFLWSLLNNLIRISDQDAPTNNPKEFLTFCGTIGLGSFIFRNDNLQDEILAKLKILASDSRWRVREAVAMALWQMIKSNPDKILEELKVWINIQNWLEIRALAAGLAEPDLLRDKNFAEKALDIYKQIFKTISKADHIERISESFKIMKRGFGYSLSVIVKEIPEIGFNYMEELAKVDDNDINWILKENLKKNRLLKNFPQKTSYIRKLIQD